MSAITCSLRRTTYLLCAFRFLLLSRPCLDVAHACIVGDQLAEIWRPADRPGVSQGGSPAEHHWLWTGS